ncbi:MAG: SLC13 family permease [Dorea sp.]
MLKNILSFLKKEIVLTISGILAVISCFFVHPDSAYAEYIDSHTILILFCLMAVMAGLKDIGLFQRVGESLLKKIHSERGIIAVLVFLCFISSMFITNDVALITFVPLALLIMAMAKMETSLCFTITLMTIAANLGSMFTPIGNPQNLYLYSVSGISLIDFLTLMLPYTLLAAVLLTLCIFIRFRSAEVPFKLPQRNSKLNKQRLVYYLILFLLCLLAVAKILPIGILFLIILLAVIKDKRNLLLHIDYSLLATFIFFFIFIGNMGRFPVFRDFLSSILEGHEKLVAVLSSQVISNVPAVLLLSGFTDKWNSLIIGTNLGGLGTLIASMASLISYKQLAQNYPDKKRNYMFVFTLWNIVFLTILYGASILIM